MDNERGEHAPPWLVRWLKTAALLATIVLLAAVIRNEVTAIDRLERDLHRANCAFALETNSNAALLVCH